MQEMLEDRPSPALLAALDANMATFWSAYGHAAGCAWHAAPDLVWFYTGIQMPLFNGVVFAQLSPDGVNAVVADLQAQIDAQGAPALWWLGPQTQPAQLGALLEQQGLRAAGQIAGMALDLRLLANQPALPANITIQRVESAEMQALWARTAAVGTEFSDAALASIVNIETALENPQYKAQRRYIGLLDGAPVATSALVLDAGVAGVYAVATIPAARRQGIGRLMTVAPLLEARQLGYRTGILQASPMGHPVYTQIGFRDICTYTLYLQAPR